MGLLTYNYFSLLQTSRSLSLKCGGVIDDFTIFEVAANNANGNNGIDSTIEIEKNFKPKVKTVPLYRPSKRSSVTRASVDSCHIAIEEMAGSKGKFILIFFARSREKESIFDTREWHI